jgi:hypothetical protein
MAYTQFKNLGSVLKKYQLKIIDRDFLSKEVTMSAPIVLSETINKKLKRRLFRVSEAAICEQLIYPILEDVWLNTIEDWLLWSHTNLDIDEDLTGIPDYLLTPPTQYGSELLGNPILVAVEAKKDNFDEGWGQCAAAMVAAQKVNTQHDYTVYGIVSNGETWQFAFLKDDQLVRNTFPVHIINLDLIYSVLHFVFTSCKKQIV